MGATAWEDTWIHQSWYLCSTSTPVGSVAINSMRIRSRKNTPDLRALKAADGKQARPSPPPGQMVKWYNMLSKKPQHILSTAVMVLIVLSALVCPWLMSKIKAKPIAGDWFQSCVSVCVCVCVCVCGRYFGLAPQSTADLETDYISEQRRTKNKETDFILTHRRGITTNDDISQRKGEKERRKVIFDEVLNFMRNIIDTEMKHTWYLIFVIMYCHRKEKAKQLSLLCSIDLRLEVSYFLDVSPEQTILRDSEEILMPHLHDEISMNSNFIYFYKFIILLLHSAPQQCFYSF